MAFLAAHPAAKAFVEAPKPIPTSFARQAYFAITAFKFTNAERPEPVRPVPPPPRSRDRVPDSRAGGEEDGRLPRRRDVGAAGQGAGAVPRAGAIGRGGDDVTDSTALWPETRPQVEFGTLTITERVDELAPERRKIIFDPVPRVDGIDSAGDPLTEVRSEIYLLRKETRNEMDRSDRCRGADCRHLR